MNRSKLKRECWGQRLSSYYNVSMGDPIIKSLRTNRKEENLINEAIDYNRYMEVMSKGLHISKDIPL